MITSWVKSYVCPRVVQTFANYTNLTLATLAKDEQLNLTAVEEIVKSNEGWWEAENTACDTSCTLIWSWTVAIFCIGGMMGGTLCGYVSSRLGRKGGLLLNNVLVAVAVVLMGLAKYAGSYQMLIAGRLVIGINSGLNAGLAPMYLSEISPTALRGAVSCILLELLFPDIYSCNSCPFFSFDNKFQQLLVFTYFIYCYAP